MWSFYVFMYYKCSKQIMYIVEEAKTFWGQEGPSSPLYPLNLCRSHWFWLGSLPAMWCLTCAASLCPGLAAPGSLCWALPSPSSFPVAPQAPPKEECRFQDRIWKIRYLLPAMCRKNTTKWRSRSKTFKNGNSFNPSTKPLSSFFALQYPRALHEWDISGGWIWCIHHSGRILEYFEPGYRNEEASTVWICIVHRWSFWQGFRALSSRKH